MKAKGGINFKLCVYVLSFCTYICYLAKSMRNVMKLFVFGKNFQFKKEKMCTCSSFLSQAFWIQENLISYCCFVVGLGLIHKNVVGCKEVVEVSIQIAWNELECTVQPYFVFPGEVQCDLGGKELSPQGPGGEDPEDQTCGSVRHPDGQAEVKVPV